MQAARPRLKQGEKGALEAYQTGRLDTSNPNNVTAATAEAIFGTRGSGAEIQTNLKGRRLKEQKNLEQVRRQEIEKAAKAAEKAQTQAEAASAEQQSSAGRAEAKSQTKVERAQTENVKTEAALERRKAMKPGLDAAEAAARNAAQPGSLVAGVEDAKAEAQRRMGRIQGAYNRGYTPQRAGGRPGRKPTPEGQVPIQNQQQFANLTQKAKDARKAGDPSAANKFTKQANKLRTTPGQRGGGATPTERFAESFGAARRMQGGGKAAKGAKIGSGANPEALKAFKPKTIAGKLGKTGGKFAGRVDQAKNIFDLARGTAELPRSQQGKVGTPKTKSLVERAKRDMPRTTKVAQGAGRMLGESERVKQLIEERNFPAAKALLEGGSPEKD